METFLQEHPSTPVKRDTVSRRTACFAKPTLETPCDGCPDKADCYLAQAGRVVLLPKPRPVPVVRKARSAPTLDERLLKGNA